MITYITICTLTHKFYVGRDRYNNPSYLGSGKILKRAINKYGRKNFSKIVLDFYSTKEAWLQGEKDCIRELHAFKFENFGGMNIGSGGEGGSLKGKNNPNYGKPKSPEWKFQMSQRMMGKKYMLGKHYKHSEEFKEWKSLDMKIKMRGKQNSLGHKQSINQISKKSKSVFQFNLNNELIKEWESSRQIERELGFDHTSISRACKNKIKTSHGFIWRYT